MRLRNIMLAILLMLAFTVNTVMADDNGTASQTDSALRSSDNGDVLEDDIAEDDSLIGPDNALYGFRLGLEDLSLAFIFDQDKKLEKQLEHASQRIAEAKAKLNKKNRKAAEIALGKYDEEMEKVNKTISRFGDNDTGLLNAQKKIAKYQYVLEQLLNATPNSTGLQRAHNNSADLVRKFGEKTEVRFERMTTKAGKKILKEIREKKDEIEDHEITQVKAEITANGSQVYIKLRFQTNSTDKKNITEDTLKELQKIKNNLGDLLRLAQDGDKKPEIEVTGTPTATLTAQPGSREESKERLDIKASVEGKTTDVKVEYKFRLNATDRDGIIKGINDKLSELTSDKILNAMEIKVRERPGELEKSVKEEKNSRKNENNDRKGGSGEKDRD
ncbi:MAG: DUF5667 domain-containing protein [Candidatus Methanoperedens sp.]|nr:DUF5667 domain-containing protein [Candidatus Methanoperedens sp.]MCZ7360979.1 DUF5667 domain-containing protein [Candidatus Methanoperedens sp.]HLB71077.1 DUF5667 domain-containing protein [Candidatus Methanoperedens sp.]